MGKTPALIKFDQWGRNPVVGTSEEDLWGLGGLHTDLTVGTQINMTCGDTLQTQSIYITGLDENWNLKTATFALNGRNLVDIGLWTSIFSAWQVSSGAAPTADVYMSVTGAALTLGVPDDPADAQCHIPYAAGLLNTAMQPWGVVPRGYCALLYQVTGEMQTQSGTERVAKFRLKVSELAHGATVDNPAWAPYRHIASMSMLSNDSPHETVEFDFPWVLGPLTRIAMHVDATANSELIGRITAVLVPLPPSWVQP